LGEHVTGTTSALVSARKSTILWISKKGAKKTFKEYIMKIQYSKGKALAILFEESDLLNAYAVMVWLKTRYNSNPKYEAILNDLALFLVPPPVVPKRLTLVVDTKICERCCRMINLKTDRYILHTENGNSSYCHQICPPLKENQSDL